MMTEQTLLFAIPDGIDEMRVDKAIALETHLPRSTISEMFKRGDVTVNGEQTKASSKVSEGDHIELTYIEREITQVVGQNIDIDIVYEDDDIVVINKQPEMVVHPGAGNPDSTLANALVYRYPHIIDVGESFRPGIVHRLDSGTSGLLVAAKTQDAYESFVSMFSIHAVNRKYTALTWGQFDTTSGIIDAPIGRHAQRMTQMAVRDDGKEARTHYVVERYFENKDVTLLDIALETGRTHQIRVHCSAIGHPIVGDKTYGGFRQSLECPRPFLHAHTLEFAHPVTGKLLTFSVQLPEDLARVLSEVENAV
jgi:23S rRNA pseudouridine1911/1915/1917 synthase